MAVSERELREAVEHLSARAFLRERRALTPLLDAAIDELVALRKAADNLARNERDAAVAEAAAAFIESIGSFAHYRSGKWQASGGDETLRRLYEAVERRDVAGRAASAATGEGGR